MAPLPKIKGLPSFEHIGLIVQSLVCFSVLFLSKMSASARNQGVDVTLLVSDGMWHVPISNGSGVPELQLAYDEMIKFFRRHMEI